MAKSSVKLRQKIDGEIVEQVWSDQLVICHFAWRMCIRNLKLERYGEDYATARLSRLPQSLSLMCLQPYTCDASTYKGIATLEHFITNATLCAILQHYTGAFQCLIYNR